MNDTTIAPCPTWCTLPAGHPWDGEDDNDRPVRSHDGPDFGLISTGGEEVEYLRLGEPRSVTGRPTAAVYARGGLTAEQLRQLAVDATAAADWLDQQEATR